MANATETLLGLVHGLLADDMRKRLESALGPNGTPLSAPEWNAIAKFLKDNNIEAVAVPGSPVADLLDGLEDFDETGKVVALR